MKYNKMMTKLLSGLILVSMAGTSLQIPTYADIMTARQVMADSQKEDNAEKDKGSTKKEFGAAGDDFSLLGSDAEGKTNASGSDNGAEESNTPIGEERSSSLSSAAAKTSSKANNSSKSSSNNTSTSQVLEPFSTEGDSSLISLDQSFSLYSYHGYASSFTATALNGDGNDIIWEVGNVKLLSVSEPTVDGAKSTVKITWDGENVETIERTPFYAKLKSNPEEKVTGTIYLSNGQKPEGDEQEQEPGSRTEFESEEVRKFMEEMYAEGLTQDNSVYDLSSFGDGSNKNETDYSNLTDDEIIALYEQQQNSEKAKTVDGAYEIAKAQLGKGANEKTDLSEGNKVDTTELEKDTENETLFNKEETQSEKTNENVNSGKVDTEIAQPAQKTTEVKTEKKTITTKTTTEVIATEDITETVTAKAVEPTEGEAADTDEAAVTETKIVGTKYTVRKTIVTETTMADGKTETDTKVEEYTTTTKPEEGTVVDTKEETVEVEVEVEADTTDELNKTKKTQTPESVKPNDTASTPTTTKTSTQSVEQSQSKSEKSDLTQLEKSTNAKSNNSGNVAKVETVVESAYDSSNLEIARTYNTSKTVLRRAETTSEEQSADGDAAAVEQSDNEDGDSDDDDSDRQPAEVSEKSTSAKSGSRLTASEKTTDVDGEDEEEAEELTELAADSDDESGIAVMYDESEIMTTAVSVTKPMVAASNAGTFALKEDGTLWAWGYNGYGTLGTGNTTTYQLPQLVASNVAKISSNYHHALLLTTDGKVMVSGRSWQGETSVGEVHTFTDITDKFAGTITDVVAGVHESYAITTGGEVYAWGYSNVGQLGVNTFNSVNNTPSKVVDSDGNAITGIKKVALGYYHTLALTNDGKIYSFGNNNYRQLGLSTTDTSNRSYANLVYDASGNVVTGATDVAANGGTYGTSWYVKDGKVYGWGYNGYGQTGDTSAYAEGYNVVPREIVGGDGVKLSNVKSIYGGGQESMGYLIAVTNSGDAYSIGYNGHGELANGDTSFTAYNNSWQRVKIDNDTYLTNVDSVAVEGWGFHTVFLRKDGTVLTSGYNDCYQLGMFTDYPDWKSNVVSGWRAYANELGSYPGTLRVYTNSAKSEVLTNSSVQMGGTFAIPTSYITGTVGYNLLNEKAITGVSFKSFNTDIATVNNSGVVTAGNKIGTAIIQLTATSTAFGGVEHTFKGLVRIDVRPQGSFTMPQVGASDYFNVALKSDGTVWTWGGNNYGGLGRGVYTYTEIATPRQAIKTPIYDENNNVIGVTEYLTNIKQIAVGGRHALALDADGTVWAWGYNADGQLGIGTSDNNAHPVPVKITTDGTTPLTDVVYISAGWVSYAVRKDGTVWACGWNAYGQAGPYTAYGDKQAVAQPISGGSTGERYLRDVIQIENGYSHVVAVKTNGTVLAWGYNPYGVGNGTRSWTPTQVVKGESNSSTIYLENVVQVAIGQGEYSGRHGHALALKDDGTVYGWGRNYEGELGIGNTEDNKNYPVKMNISDAVYISAGATQYYGASHIIKSDGTMWATGYNGYGQLGIGSTVAQNTPQQVVNVYVNNTYNDDGSENYEIVRVPFTGAVAVDDSLQGQHTIAIKNDGSIWVWGHNGYGELGYGVYDGSALTEFNVASNAWQWGQTYFMQPAQVGNEDSDVLVPYRGTKYKFDGSPETVGDADGVITGEDDDRVTHIYLRGGFAGSDADYFAIDTSNIYRKTNFSLAMKESEPVETTVSFSSVNTDIATVDSSGVIRPAEKGLFGTTQILMSATVTKMGVTRTYKGMIYVNVLPPDGIAMPQVAAGFYHTVALKKDGTVWAWGYNGYGELGNGKWDGVTVPHPTQVVKKMNEDGTVAEYLDNIIQVAAGHYCSWALDSDGHVWAWGYNNHGEQGRGITTGTNKNPIPQMVAATVETVDGVVNVTSYLSNVVYISGGFHSIMALKKDGSVWGWGWNDYGQLGTAANAYQSIPVRAVGGRTGSEYLTDVVQFDTGYASTAVVKANGTVWTMGNDPTYGTSNYLNSGAAAQEVVKGHSTETNMYLNDVVQVSVGGHNSSTRRNYTLALKSDGTVYGWGRNAEGQLGDGTGTDNRVRPVKMNIDGVTAVNASLSGTYGSSYMMKKDGSIWATGSNANGQLGVGSTAYQYTPVPVVNISAEEVKDGDGNISYDVTQTPIKDMVQVSGSNGAQFAVGVKRDGTIWTWGENGNGTLGMGVAGGFCSEFNVANNAYQSNQTYIMQPREVGGNSDVLSVRKIEVSTNVGTDSYLGSGLVGDDTTVFSNITLRGDDINAVASEADLKYDAIKIKAGNVYRKQSFNILYDVATPITNTDSYTFTMKSMDESIAVVDGNVIRPANKGKYGMTQILLTSTVEENGVEKSYKGIIRVNIAHNKGIARPQVAAGNYFTVALKYDGTVWAWGYNNYGQLGQGDKNDVYIPVQVKGGDQGGEYLKDIVEVSVGASWTMALDKDGYVWTWGYNNCGQLGQGTADTKVNPLPMKVAKTVIRDENGTITGVEEYLGNIVHIAAGHFHALALAKDGTVWAWGYNNKGQLGNGNNANQYLPVRVLGGESGSQYLSDVVQLSASYAHSIALKANGTVWTWGNNYSGSLGNATTSNSYVPVQVWTGEQGSASGKLENAVQVDVNSNEGEYYPISGALTEDKQVYGWGYECYGVFGFGEARRTQPIKLKSSEAIKTVQFSLGDAGAWNQAFSYMLLLKDDGTVTATDSRAVTTITAPGESAAVSGADAWATMTMTGTVMSVTNVNVNVALNVDGLDPINKNYALKLIPRTGDILSIYMDVEATSLDEATFEDDASIPGPNPIGAAWIDDGGYFLIRIPQMATATEYLKVTTVESGKQVSMQAVTKMVHSDLRTTSQEQSLQQ